MTQPKLQVNDLSRQYGGRAAVSGVSFAVMPGQVTCLLGPSGCGKSTTLRMIAGVETPSGGEIHVDGQTIYGAALNVPPEQRGIGMMFQDFALFPHLSVWENVAFGLRGSRGDRRARAFALLARVNLHDFADKMPADLSGGEQQRVALARAIAPKPHIMLLDEPFSGLDDRLRDSIRDETLNVMRDDGTAVVMVTHDPAEAMKMADQIILMRDGGVVQQGTPYAIFNTPVDRECAAFFSDINIIPSVVHGALADTPFGQFFAPGYDDGTKIEIVIRPQHLKIDFDRAGKGPTPTDAVGQAARATVKRARFLGHYSLVDFEMQDGTVLMASVPSVFLPRAGTPFWLMAPRKYCYVFAS